MSAPPGFARLEIPAGFAAEFGPIYARRDGERVFYGFRVEARHLNPRGIAHGGAIATFADMHLAALMRMGRLEVRRSPTISLAVDYLAPARTGDWVEGEIVLVKRTGRLAFAQTVLSVEGAPVARAHGLYAHSEKAVSLDAPAPEPPAGIDAEAPPPEGFAPHDPGAGFGAFFGPMAIAGGRIGFRVAARHINLFGVCHGGALAMLADYQIGALRRSGAFAGPFTPTLSLNVDFLSPARLGDWVEMTPVLTRATSRFAFTQATLVNAEGPVARATAIYAISHIPGV